MRLLIALRIVKMRKVGPFNFLRLLEISGKSIHQVSGIIGWLANHDLGILLGYISSARFPNRLVEYGGDLSFRELFPELQAGVQDELGTLGDLHKLKAVQGNV